MKLKSLLFVSCLSLLSSAYAAEYVQPTNAQGVKLVAKAPDSQLGYPGWCEIEVVNESDWDVIVSARATNGLDFNFLVRSYGPSRTMDLTDRDTRVCPDGAYVSLKYADTGEQFYSKFYYPGALIRIFNSSSNAIQKLQVLTTKK